ncbi:hypothetical protein NQZ68_022075 [Dissostichus eleginoides]|nr:hypothetical protein NQZ68_022075 [Dissostichus eleginoides]
MCTSVRERLQCYNNTRLEAPVTTLLSLSVIPPGYRGPGPPPAAPTTLHRQPARRRFGYLRCHWWRRVVTAPRSPCEWRGGLSVNAMLLPRLQREGDVRG